LLKIHVKLSFFPTVGVNGRGILNPAGEVGLEHETDSGTYFVLATRLQEAIRHYETANAVALSNHEDAGE
jgi:hypothetical protein